MLVGALWRSTWILFRAQSIIILKVFFAIKPENSITFLPCVAPGSLRMHTYVNVQPICRIVHKPNVLTYFANSFSSSFATGARVNFSVFFPSGLPRWEQRTTLLAFCSRQYWMDGRAATIRALLVMAPETLSWGTLKSHLKLGYVHTNIGIFLTCRVSLRKCVNVDLTSWKPSSLLAVGRPVTTFWGPWLSGDRSGDVRSFAVMQRAGRGQRSQQN